MAVPRAIVSSNVLFASAIALEDLLRKSTISELFTACVLPMILILDIIPSTTSSVFSRPILKAFITDTSPSVAESKFIPGEIVANMDEYFAIFVAASAVENPKRLQAAACSIISLVVTPICFAVSFAE